MVHTDSRGGGAPPAILLGGGANAVSVARSLGRQGIPVYALNHPGAPVGYSRHCRQISLDGDATGPDAWERYVLGSESDWLCGAVLLACSDDGIEILIRHAEVLSAKFRLERGDPGDRRNLLDKLTTYRIADAAGVPTPRYWLLDTAGDLEAIRDELVFPLIIKPRLSHKFEQKYEKKYMLARTMDELHRGLARTRQDGMDVMLVELIPGDDDKLCSYYTYVDEHGDLLFDYTKRIIRRYPKNMGPACYHVTDWIPELAGHGQRFFRHLGFRGLGNIEFKLDVRDGILKMIECNARFTASDYLIACSGLELGLVVYRDLTGQPQALPASYRQGMTLWSPVEDFHAFRERRRNGELTFGRWLLSVLRPQVFQYFSWRDPMPGVAHESERLRRVPRLVDRLGKAVHSQPPLKREMPE